MTEELHSMIGGNNVFRDLGFSEDEAQALLLQGDLAMKIRIAVDELGITQAEAAQRAEITQLHMNDRTKNRNQTFTLDAMTNIASRLGYVVKLSLQEVG